MSNLIQFPNKIDYSGKSIAISPETPLSKFQCRGFVVYRKNPTVVPPEADHERIHYAITAGQLIELKPGEGIKTSNASLNSPLDLGETDKKIFTLQTKEGIAVITPESAEQSAQIEKELQETGHLILANYPTLQIQKSMTGLSAITITDLEPEE